MKLMAFTAVITVMISTLGFAQGPNIEIDRSFNFGTIVQGGNGSHSFVVKNTGDSPLIIEKAMTACGCDVGSAPKEPILPGDSAVVVYKYDTNRIGPFVKTLRVGSNDIDEPNVIIRIKGNVIVRKEKLETQ